MELRIRRMPDDLHKWLKINAIEAGVSLNDFIIECLKTQKEMEAEREKINNYDLEKK